MLFCYYVFVVNSFHIQYLNTLMFIFLETQFSLVLYVWVYKVTIQKAGYRILQLVYRKFPGTFDQQYFEILYWRWKNNKLILILIFIISIPRKYQAILFWNICLYVYNFVSRNLKQFDYHISTKLIWNVADYCTPLNHW